MSLDETKTLYDILDLRPDASPQEVREGYLRTKSAFNKDSAALYTLITTEEREEIMVQIEEAYEILSNPDKRRDYDAHHGFLTQNDEFFSHSRPPAHKKIVSIDRVPPMDPAADDLLVPPPTDFSIMHPRQDGAPADPFSAPVMPSRPKDSGTGAQATPDPSATEVIGEGGTAPSAPTPPYPPVAPTAAAGAPSAEQNPASQPSSPDPGPHFGHAQPGYSHATAEANLAQEVAREVEWHGPFLKKVREIRRLSIEEMSAITKISRGYLFAIEEENFAKLPAAVYLRGFIIQVAKTLRLPHEKVATAYMARYYQARPDQAR